MSSSSAKVISNQSDIKVNREHFSIFNKIYINLGIRSTKNTSEMLRVSCDTRWQRADQPIDPRLMFMMMMLIPMTIDPRQGLVMEGMTSIIERVTWQLTQSDREGDTNIDHEGDDNDKLISILLIKFNFCFISWWMTQLTQLILPMTMIMNWLEWQWCRSWSPLWWWWWRRRRRSWWWWRKPRRWRRGIHRDREWRQWRSWPCRTNRAKNRWRSWWRKIWRSRS